MGRSIGIGMLFHSFLDVSRDWNVFVVEKDMSEVHGVLSAPYREPANVAGLVPIWHFQCQFDAIVFPQGSVVHVICRMGDQDANTIGLFDFGAFVTHVKKGVRPLAF